MPRALLTGSTRWRGALCPPSVVLSQVGSVGPDRVGNLIHAHLALRISAGVDDAMRAIPDLCAALRLSADEAGIATARCRSFEWCPPRGAIGEVALCLFEDGHVELIRGGHGQYDMPEGGIFALTVDVIWAEMNGRPVPFLWQDGRPLCPPGAVVWAADYKTGDAANVQPVEQNDQLEAAALLAARWLGAEMVAPAVILVRKGRGIWDVPEAYWGGARLDRIEQAIRAEHARVQEAARALAEGSLTEGFVTGDHCEHCPAQSRCSAKTAALVALAGEVPSGGELALTEDHLRRLLPMASQLEAAARKIREAARAHVQATGASIDLQNGNIWGPHHAPKKELIVEVALPLLVAEVGEAHARDALKATLPRDAIKAAFRAAHPDSSSQEIERLVRGFFAAVIQAGGQRDKGEIHWSEHKPTGGETPVPIAPALPPKGRGKRRRAPVQSHAITRYLERVNPGADPGDACAEISAAASRSVALDDQGRMVDPETGLRTVQKDGKLVTVLGGPLRVPLAEVASVPARTLRAGAPLLSPAPSSPEPSPPSPRAPAPVLRVGTPIRIPS